MYSIGQRVGIVSGLQAVGGPVVTQYGTVTAVEEFWVGTLEYQVTPDDGSEALWYRGYLLRSVAEPTPMGPVCAACGDATCVADDAHHKVTGAPTNVAPFFTQANVARGMATDNDDQVADMVAEREAWLDQAQEPAQVAPVARDIWSDPETDRIDAQDRYIEQGHAYLRTLDGFPYRRAAVDVKRASQDRYGYGSPTRY